MVITCTLFAPVTFSKNPAYAPVAGGGGGDDGGGGGENVAAAAEPDRRITRPVSSILPAAACLGQTVICAVPRFHTRHSAASLCIQRRFAAAGRPGSNNHDIPHTSSSTSSSRPESSEWDNLLELGLELELTSIIFGTVCLGSGESVGIQAVLASKFPAYRYVNRSCLGRNISHRYLHQSKKRSRITELSSNFERKTAMNTVRQISRHREQRKNPQYATCLFRPLAKLQQVYITQER